MLGSKGQYLDQKANVTQPDLQDRPVLGAGGELPVHLLLGGGQDVGEPGAGRDHVLPGGAPGLAPAAGGRVLLVTVVLAAVCDLHTFSQPRGGAGIGTAKNRFQKKLNLNSNNKLCFNDASIFQFLTQGTLSDPTTKGH